jgi:hypothetical protein
MFSKYTFKPEFIYQNSDNPNKALSIGLSFDLFKGANLISLEYKNTVMAN